MTNRPNPNPQPQPPTPPLPGAHHDDASVAGEEDPGASLGELPKPKQAPAASPAPRDKPSP